MGRLRVTYVTEYGVDPADYGVATMEEAAAEEVAAFALDFIGTLANLEGDSTLTVEVI